MADNNKSADVEVGLTERAQRLLKVLVERYINDGQPVGSRTLSRDSGLVLSPATIRNVMSDLEDMGYLSSPHTSAGRVPTARGYRFFIDSLLQLRPLESEQVDFLRRHLNPDQDTPHLIQSVSSLLSGFTRLAGIVMVPRHNVSTLRQVEFLPLSGDRVLVILVVNEREVQNRIIHVQRRYTEAELQQAANFLNAEFCGKSIESVRKTLLREMQQAQQKMSGMMAAVVEMADKSFSVPSEEEDFVLAGETNLMDCAELSDMERLRQLFEAFNQKRDLLHLLDQCLSAEGIQIFIGEEAGFEVFEACSMIAAPYSVGGRLVGVLGVIGPTRMAYERVIPIVDVTAKLLASALNSRD